MKPRTLQYRFRRELSHGVTAILFIGLLSQVRSATPAQQASPGQQAQSQVMTTTTPDTGQAAQKLSSDQLDSLVAPIALYPDQLLSQTLVASTYPLEIIQLQQWMEKNKNLKGKALSTAVEKQPWDPSIQAMAAFPDVVTRLADNIQWTTDLGNAFLAQESDVMDAVQAMRAKAQSNGTLKTTAQQTVQTQTVSGPSGGKQVIMVQQAQPDVVYVPSYNPTVVYGAPAYPYPPIAYPPPGYYAAGGPLHSEQALLWERHVVEAGVGTADGVVAMLTLTSTTSTLTTITRTLTPTLTRRTLTKPTIIRPTRSIAVRGNIIRNIAEALLTTGRQQARSKINWQIGDRVEQELAIAPALEPAPEIGPVLAELELDQVQIGRAHV